MFAHLGDPSFWFIMVVDTNYIEKAYKNTLGEAIEWAINEIAQHEGRDTLPKLAQKYALEEDGNIQYGQGDQYVVFLEREGVRPND